MIQSELLRSNDVLRDALATHLVTDAAGARIPLSSNIPLAYAEALFAFIRRERPANVLEVGMAHGISTLGILSALRLAGSGRLTSIDPHQSSYWRSIGTLNVDRAGLADIHEHIEKVSSSALPWLVDRGTTIDFAYIDGWHTFDYALLDFWYIDRMLPVGGVVTFNDCDWHAVHKVIKFVLTHRKYEEISVGLPKDFASTNPLGRIRRRLTGRNAADRYFRKVADWEPRYDYFKNF